MAKKGKLKANAIAKDRESAARKAKKVIPAKDFRKTEGRYCEKDSPSFGKSRITGIDC